MERRAAAESEGFTGDGRKQTVMATKNRDQVSPMVKNQLEAGTLEREVRSHFSTAFASVSPPFPFPIPQTTMADAAEHDEELVDYDEEEVG